MLVVVVVVVVVGRAAAAAVGGGGSGLTEPGSYTACFLHLVMKWINSGWNGTLSMRCVCACVRAPYRQVFVIATKNETAREA